MSLFKNEQKRKNKMINKGKYLKGNRKLLYTMGQSSIKGLNMDETHIY